MNWKMKLVSVALGLAVELLEIPLRFQERLLHQVAAIVFRAQVVRHLHRHAAQTVRADVLEEIAKSSQAAGLKFVFRLLGQARSLGHRKSAHG